MLLSALLLLGHVRLCQGALDTQTLLDSVLHWQKNECGAVQSHAETKLVACSLCT